MKVNIILGSSCNLKCKSCIQKGVIFNNKKVDINDFCHKLLTCIYPIDSISFGGGEPLLYMHYIRKIVEHTGCNSIITTNGALINDEYVEFANSNNIFTVISICGQKIPECHIRLKRLSYNFLVTGAVKRTDLVQTDKLIFFNIQHNVPGLDYITKEHIDNFFMCVSTSDYLKRKFVQYYDYVLSKKSDLPNCFNRHTVSIDLHFNKYLCFRKLDSKIGRLNDIIEYHHPYYSHKCSNCFLQNVCKGGCIVSETPEIECYWMRKGYDYFQGLQTRNAM